MVIELGWAALLRYKRKGTDDWSYRPETGYVYRAGTKLYKSQKSAERSVGRGYIGFEQSYIYIPISVEIPE